MKPVTIATKSVDGDDGHPDYLIRGDASSSTLKVNGKVRSRMSRVAVISVDRLRTFRGETVRGAFAGLLRRVEGAVGCLMMVFGPVTGADILTGPYGLALLYGAG